MCQQCSTEPKIISENTIIVQKYTHHSQIKFTHYCGNGHSWLNLQPNSENRYPEVWLGTQKVKKVPIAYRIGTRSLKWGPFLEQWKNNALAVAGFPGLVKLSLVGNRERMAWSGNSFSDNRVLLWVDHYDIYCCILATCPTCQLSTVYRQLSTIIW